MNLLNTYHIHRKPIIYGECVTVTSEMQIWRVACNVYKSLSDDIYSKINLDSIYFFPNFFLLFIKYGISSNIDTNMSYCEFYAEKNAKFVAYFTDMKLNGFEVDLLTKR